MADAVLQCQSLAKKFGERPAVDDVTFSIAPGEIYGLLGPNGAGKTTTIRMVCGLLHADGGTVTLDGEIVDYRSVDPKGSIGYVPQDVALYPDLTTRENLEFFGRLYKLRGRLLAERVDEVLQLIDLADRADERVESFSGGMKRRLNIGASLLHRPRLLVLDEPTVGVDPQSRHAILENVSLFGSQGMAVLYTTHYMEEAERVCHRVGIIDHGRLIAEGTRRELVQMVSERDRIELAGTGRLDEFALASRGLEGVEEATTADGQVHVLARDGRRILPNLLGLAERTGVTVKTVDVIEPDLEAVFLHLTGTALRE